METLIEVNKKVDNKTVIFEVSWELDETNADKTFKTIYDDIWDFKDKNIILNFSGLNYLNSKSIWYIADLFSNIEDVQWKMFITNCNDWVKDILELVGITTIVPTVDDEKDALADINW